MQNSECQHTQPFEKKAPILPKTHKTGKEQESWLLFLTGKRKQLLSVKTSCLVQSILTQQLFLPIRLEQRAMQHVIAAMQRRIISQMTTVPIVPSP